MHKTAEQILTEANLNKTFWGGRIIRAEKRGAITDNDWVRCEDWTTCACGRQDKRIPRCLDGKPEDFDLENLGCSFENRLKTRNYKDAAITLIAIEERAAEILSGLTK